MAREAGKGGGGMTEARASWNMRYVSADGFDMMVTLRDEDEAALLARADKVVAEISKEGGGPRGRSISPRETLQKGGRTRRQTIRRRTRPTWMRKECDAATDAPSPDAVAARR